MLNTKTSIKYILIFINISLYLTSLVTWIAIPEYLLFNIILLSSSIIFTTLLFFNKRKKILQLFKNEKFVKFNSYVVSSFIIFLILGLINYLGYKYIWQIDLSNEKINSLSEQSQQIIRNLNDELNIKIFVRNKDTDKVVSYFELYKLYYKNINIEVINPDLNPNLVNTYKIDRYGTTVLEYKGKKAKINKYSEQEITKKILLLSRKKKIRISFTQGHNEHKFDNNSNGINFLKKLLIEQNYKVKNIVLSNIKDIKEQTDILSIWGPKESFLTGELKKIEKFLKKGGKILIGLDPNFNINKLKKLRELISKWGINISNNIVIDKKSFVSGSKSTIPLITNYNSHHKITKDFNGQTFFPLASSVDLIQNKKFKGSRLLFTSNFPYSWAEKNFKELIDMKMEFNPEKDKKGPISLMAINKIETNKENKKIISKIVAFGNSTFTQNVYQNYGANFNLFLNSISWLSDEVFFITQDRTTIKNSPTFLSNVELSIIFYFSLIIAPLLLIIMASFMYIRRQKS